MSVKFLASTAGRRAGPGTDSPTSPIVSAILICAYGAYDAYGAYGPKTQIINFLVFSDNYRAVLNFSSHFPLIQGLPKTFQAF